jgi:hypothetical protein
MTGVALGDWTVGTGDGVGSAVAVCGVTTGDWKLDAGGVGDATVAVGVAVGALQAATASRVRTKRKSLRFTDCLHRVAALRSIQAVRASIEASPGSSSPHQLPDDARSSDIVRLLVIVVVAVLSEVLARKDESGVPALGHRPHVPCPLVGERSIQEPLVTTA